MSWEVEFTDEFGRWWSCLSDAAQESVAASVRLLEMFIGGDKTGDERWYEVHVPMADRLYREHLRQLRKEGLIDG